MDSNFDIKTFYNNNLISFDMKDIKTTFNILDLEIKILDFIDLMKKSDLKPSERLCHIHMYNSDYKYLGAFVFNIIVHRYHKHIHMECLWDIRKSILNICLDDMNWGVLEGFNEPPKVKTIFHVGIDNKIRIFDGLIKN